MLLTRTFLLALVAIVVGIAPASCQKVEVRDGVSAQFFNENGEALSPQLQLELASTPAQQQMGLMYRTEMEQDAGMLFIFEDEQPRSFWMKNTQLSLDIIYLDSKYRVVSIVHSATPLSEKPRPSGLPTKYVVEVNSGLAKKWGLKKGSVFKSEAF